MGIRLTPLSVLQTHPNIMAKHAICILIVWQQKNEGKLNNTFLRRPNCWPRKHMGKSLWESFLLYLQYLTLMG